MQSNYSALFILAIYFTTFSVDLQFETTSDKSFTKSSISILILLGSSTVSTEQNTNLIFLQNLIPSE